MAPMLLTMFSETGVWVVFMRRGTQVLDLS